MTKVFLLDDELYLCCIIPLLGRYFKSWWGLEIIAIFRRLLGLLARNQGI
jgi:hypothetical protein